MNGDFIALQIKRIRRNIIILAVLLILPAVFVKIYRGAGAMLAAVLIIAFVLQPIKVIKVIKKIKSRTINKVLSVYGLFSEVAQNINSEVSGPNYVKYGNVIITDSWILKLNTFSLDVIKIDDIVWVYRDITSHKQGAIITGVYAPPEEMAKTFAVIINTVNPIIPTLRISTTHMSNMDDSKEAALEGMEKDQRMRDIFEALCQRNPKAIFGYSRELARMWAGDKSRFIEQVKLAAEGQNFNRI